MQLVGVTGSMGFETVQEWVSSVLHPRVSLLLLLCFVGFFVVTGLVLAFHRRRYTKRTYVAGFLAVLVVVNFIGLPVLPITFWHKFSKDYPETQTHYELRIVDSTGDELVYDESATLAVDTVTIEKLKTKMRTEFSPAKNERVARYLVERARQYRKRVTDPSPLRFVRFPPHGVFDRWDERTLSQYSTFVGIRLYEIHLRTSDDGSEVLSYSENVRLELFPYMNGSVAANATAFASAPPTTHRRSRAIV